MAGAVRLPYSLLADPDAEVSDAYDQPVRFGPLGRFSDFLGRAPEVVILDRRNDRPSVDDRLAERDGPREE